MPRLCHKFALIVLLQCLPVSLLAGEFKVSLEIPRLDVAEYHRPYVAMWVAEENNRVATNLSVLYDIEIADREGEKWLKDLRQWWRRSGRRLEMPVDGMTGATRVPGKHAFDFTDRVAELAPGDYRLIVEVVREVGGREMLEIPFRWPVAEANRQETGGEEEVGRVILELAP